jgi:hypothetical protein
VIGTLSAETIASFLRKLLGLHVADTVSNLRRGAAGRIGLKQRARLQPTFAGVDFPYVDDLAGTE